MPALIHAPPWARASHNSLLRVLLAHPCGNRRTLANSSRVLRSTSSKRVHELPFAAPQPQGDGWASPLPPWPSTSASVPPRQTKARRARTSPIASAAQPLADTRDAHDERPPSPSPFDRVDELGPERQQWPPLAKEVLTNLARFPACTLLTRVGGFYEAYFEQAPSLASMLGIKLASRTWGGRTVAMAGFPVSQLDKHLKVLVQDHGQLVAICDEFKQLPSDVDPKAVVERRKRQRRSTAAAADKKGDEGGTQSREPAEPSEDAEENFISPSLNASPEITRRVTRVVSRGTLIDEKFLDPFSSNWILSVCRRPETRRVHDASMESPAGASGGQYGLAWLDVSTAEFQTMACEDAESVRDEVARLKPTEVLLEPGALEEGDGGASGEAFLTGASAARGALDTGHPIWEAIDSTKTLVSILDVEGGWDAADSPAPGLGGPPDAISGTVSQTPPKRRGRPSSKMSGPTSATAQQVTEVEESSPAERAAAANLTRHLRRRLLELSEASDPNSPHSPAWNQLTGEGPIHRIGTQSMLLDANTLAALEVRDALREGGGVRGTLLSTVRRTVTRGGARLLGQWLTAPSTDLSTITRRLSLVSLLKDRAFARDDVRTLLRRGAGDVARSLQRVAARRNDEQDLLEVRDFALLCARLAEYLEEIWSQGHAVAAVRDSAAGRGGVGVMATARDEEQGWSSLRKWLDKLARLDELGAMLAVSIDEGVMERRLRAREALERETEERVGLEQVRTSAVEGQEVLVRHERRRVAADVAAVRPPDTEADSAVSAPVGDSELWGAPFEHLIRPSVSKRLSSLTKEHLALRSQAGRLEQSLRRRYASERVSLRFLQGQGFVVHFGDWRERSGSSGGCSPSDDGLALAYKSKTTRTYYHDGWTRLGTSLARLDAELRRSEGVELERLRQTVLGHAREVRGNVRLVDELDVLASFAHLAEELSLCRPRFVEEEAEHEKTGTARQSDGLGGSIGASDARTLEIKGARHLGVEMGLLEVGRGFTSNDVSMGEDSRVHIITGPNMGGKSTYLRSVAVICILAQCGSFVPAKSARLSLVDRIFSRVGARDDVSRDRSTFLCEMQETSSFLRRATRRSLVVADEVGRGTSSDVGLAIAHASVWYLHERVGCRALFATHLHDVAELVDGWLPAVEFFCTDVEEDEAGRITYLHRLRRGVNSDSHGLKVARLAAMPDEAVRAAEATLEWLQSTRKGRAQGATADAAQQTGDGAGQFGEIAEGSVGLEQLHARLRQDPRHVLR